MSTSTAHENIVIVGASLAGHNLANSLTPILPSTHRILLVDALDYGFFPIASLRAAVVPGWEDKITVPLTTETVFPSGTPHQVIAPNKVIELKENSIILEKPFEGSTEVPFHRCVIATGSSQPSPMRPPENATREGYLADLRKTQEEIRNAKKIVVIGGGTVGVEFAGEVRAAYPDSEITIVHSDVSLLSPAPASSITSKTDTPSWTSPPTNPKLSRSLCQIAESLNITLILSDRAVLPNTETEVLPGQWDGSFGLQNGTKKLSLKSGKEIEGDYFFKSIGNKPTSWLVRNADAEAITDGMVKVDDYLKISSADVSSPLTKNSNYYAIGDVAAAPGWKTAFNAGNEAKMTATNLLNEIQGKPMSKYNPGAFSVLFVPVGPANGAGALTLPYLGTFVVGATMVKLAKAGDLLIGKVWNGLWQGSEKIQYSA